VVGRRALLGVLVTPVLWILVDVVLGAWLRGNGTPWLP
jgi:hypothetical protein